MPPENEALSEIHQEIEKLEYRWQENPKGRVFAHLADAYRKAGEFSKAEGLILHGLKNHPNYISAYIVLGRIYLDSERFSDAHSQFTKVLELDPQNLISLKFLGDLAVQGGRFEDARSWYERMLHVDPRNKEAEESLKMLGGGETDPLPAESQAGEFDMPEAVAAVPDPDEPLEAPGQTGEVDWGAELSALDEMTSGMGESTPVEGFIARDPSAAGETTQPESEDMPWDSLLEADSEGAPAGASPSEGDSSLNFDDMKGWTPGFLSKEDLAAEGIPDEELFGDLSGDVSLDLDAVGQQPTAAESATADEDQGAGMVTETMAELYAGQGLFDDALRVYRQLLQARPNDERLQNRVREIEDRMARDRAASAAEVPEAPVEEPPAVEVTPPEFDTPEPIEPAATATPAMPETPTMPVTPAKPVTPPMPEPPEPPAAPAPPAASVPPAAATPPEAPAAPAAPIVGAGGNGGEAEAGFDFSASAPEAGLIELDPFAGSFDLASGKSTDAGAAEAPSAGEPVGFGFEADEMSPTVPEPEPSSVEFASTEPAVVSDVGATEVVEVGSELPPEPAPIAEPAVAAAAETIEDYLTRLLRFDPSEPPPEGGGDSGASPASPPGGPPSGGDPDDMAQFQEWLRSLKR